MNRSASDLARIRPAASSRGERAERAIVEAVLDLLDNENVENLTMDKIAAAAHVGKPTIYRRWSSKAELVAYALNSLVREPPLAVSTDLRETLVAALSELRERLTDTRHGRVWRKLLGSQEQYRDALDVYLYRYLIPRKQELVAEVQRHMRTDDTSAEVLVEVIVNAVLGSVMLPGPLSSSADPGVIVDTFLQARRPVLE
ncbi:TetR/AcrR family transcriptional regulator [Nocardia carnea]|uniref:TetR/AcrR family transcriptional regulator n=1 Tax=Nocardia carnea TaxID=37328 RepID=UPI0024559084|nr:TetR/AcrR family transcriptional regulator [Nocardia carnea]